MTADGSRQMFFFERSISSNLQPLFLWDQESPEFWVVAHQSWQSPEPCSPQLCLVLRWVQKDRWHRLEGDRKSITIMSISTCMGMESLYSWTLAHIRIIAGLAAGPVVVALRLNVMTHGVFLKMRTSEAGAGPAVAWRTAMRPCHSGKTASAASSWDSCFAFSRKFKAWSPESLELPAETMNSRCQSWPKTFSAHCMYYWIPADIRHFFCSTSWLAEAGQNAAAGEALLLDWFWVGMVQI